MDEESIDVSPIDAVGALLPQDSFTAHIAGGGDTYGLFDF